MTTNIDTRDVCCVALELSKTSWVCAFTAPGDRKVANLKIKAGDVDGLLSFLNSSNAKASTTSDAHCRSCLLRDRLGGLPACPAAMGEATIKLRTRMAKSDDIIEIEVTDRDAAAANKALELLGKRRSWRSLSIAMSTVTSMPSTR